MLGYFIETTATHAEKMLSAPLSETFIHRQTTANQVRFTTVPLSEMETKILNAGNHALEIEKRLYEGLRGAILDIRSDISDCARAGRDGSWPVAGRSGARRKLVPPKVDDSRAFEIRRAPSRCGTGTGTASGRPFIANDCDLRRRQREHLAADRPEHGG